ncbi:DUF4160 domain-containing protein [Dyadobacter sp. CY261]|uniref:DUF4160 domain-containing protein n=1 Tax=Dyadobacter sp. CY261 TaxID=2907203 RepID=UPI001F15E7E9|nr:DUF4160 domain-containing protein [Dyadobacter sp. CY261]MCF0071446.1 DUF4160 domain-containing protein [Dyadobacter sp. CY261]
MPEISRFFGIIISMYFDDHNPPHFHAISGTPGDHRYSKCNAAGWTSSSSARVIENFINLGKDFKSITAR